MLWYEQAANDIDTQHESICNIKPLDKLFTKVHMVSIMYV